MIIVKNERSLVRILGTRGRVYRIDPYFNVTEIRPRDYEADQLVRQLVTHERGPIIHHILQVVRASGVQLKERRRGTRLKERR